MKLNNKPFNKVLVANRGEIAVRVLRCLHSLHIESVVVYHHCDYAAPWVKQAGEAMEVVGESPSAAHLDIQQIVEICQRLDVDAVHPGYGFLAENAGFANALAFAGIRFIGPSEHAIDLMGDKIRSRDFVMQHGFPVAPSISMDVRSEGFTEAVSQMGFPVVVKASAGGGGKGMSIVRTREDLASVVKVASSEAQKYFGDSRVYVEPYFDSARHIEVQVLGDGEQLLHLGDRDCTVQRRFQKIIEESPSPVLSEQKRDEICAAAVGIAKAANYTNAGTVEFLYTPNGKFYFLEMNTRIQVEHPVTEMVTGIDLIAEQIKIASGQPLELTQADIEVKGVSIECRICAEDAYQGFLPETGKVLFLKTPEGDGVRVDSGLYQHQIIGTAFDPLLAKLVVHADDRNHAIEKMLNALSEFVLLGVSTNIDYLSQILLHPQFVSKDFDTAFVVRHAERLQPSPLAGDPLNAILCGAMLADEKITKLMDETPQPYAAIGAWRN